MSVPSKVLFTAHVDSHILAFHIPYLKYFKSKGYEVHVASHGDATVPHADVKYDVPIERSPLKLNNLHAIRQLKGIIDSENYDIIHTHTPMGSVVTRLAAMAARKKGTRVIYTAHGFHFFTGAPLLNWLVYYPVEKWMARYTDTLITINDEDYQRAKKNFKTNVQYVQGVGVDESRFNPHLTKKQRDELRASLGVKPDDFVIIYPAELNKNKNQAMLIRAMQILAKDGTSIHLLLPGQDSASGFHARMIQAMGLERNVHLLGYRSDMPQLLQASDMSVSASYREGLPVHIMEAMAAGLPVVSTKCRGATELIQDGKNGRLVDFDNARQMAGAVRAYMRDTSKYKEASRESRLRFGNYTLKSIVERMGVIYGVASR